MSLLGVDVGTSGCKAVAMAEDGRCIGSAWREVPVRHPREGWAQIDSAEAMELVRSAIAEAAGRARGDPVEAVGISSMGEAATPVSRDGRILGPAILMSDARGAEYVDALRRRISQEEFYQINPNILGAHYTMPKLCWLRDHQPGLYRQADLFLLWADLVAFMLGGRALTNYSHANRTLLFDIRAEDWSDRLLAASGLDRDKLAPCAPCGTVAGMAPAGLAAELGLKPGAAIVVGGHDQCCNALGAGIIRPGSAVCGIGTYECITPVLDRIPEPAAMLALLAQGLCVEHHVLPGLYVSFLYNQGGLLVRWFRDTFASAASADRKLAGEGMDIYDALAAEMPDEPTDLLVLPHFEMTGPPRFEPGGCGAIVGLSSATRRGEILKAIMECETFYFVEGLEALRRMGISTREFIATGGGAKSDRWLQIKADILGVPLVRPRVTEAAALGAAMLAGLAVGRFATPQQAVERFIQGQQVFEPDVRRHELYRQRLEQYRRLWPALRPLLAPQGLNSQP